MNAEAKDVANSELAVERSELELADIRIGELEQQLMAAQAEITRLREELASLGRSTQAQETRS